MNYLHAAGQALLLLAGGLLVVLCAIILHEVGHLVMATILRQRLIAVGLIFLRITKHSDGTTETRWVRSSQRGTLIGIHPSILDSTPKIVAVALGGIIANCLGVVTATQLLPNWREVTVRAIDAGRFSANDLLAVWLMANVAFAVVNAVPFRFGGFLSDGAVVLGAVMRRGGFHRFLVASVNNNGFI